MGVFNGARLLSETVDSVLAQTARDFEFIIVNDGSTDPQVAQILTDYERRDGRVRIISKSNEGLTKALIDGCAAARGVYIARIDAGDAMPPERLLRQRALLDAHSEVVLATCWTEFCGPEWETLYLGKEKTPFGGATGFWIADVLPERPGENLLEGPTSHPSVMFRADAYRRAGGYRWQFYHGQDWDLWYRLAELGRFAGVQEILCRCRIFPEGISMRNAERQRRIHECSYGAFQARKRDADESGFLKKAKLLRPAHQRARFSRPSVSGQGSGCYFIGEALRRNGDRRCQSYFLKALAVRPLMIKIWFRLMQSLFIRTGLAPGHKEVG